MRYRQEKKEARLLVTFKELDSFRITMLGSSPRESNENSTFLIKQALNARAFSMI